MLNHILSAKFAYHKVSDHSCETLRFLVGGEYDFWGWDGGGGGAEGYFLLAWGRGGLFFFLVRVMIFGHMGVQDFRGSLINLLFTI